jgi:tRNA threonylcarbamoyl adenosine modification protein (Sua5/YciO/YrdC/YwlC family)
VEAVRLRLGDLPEAEIARRAAAALREGGIALLPAEGVYGFHVIAESAAAVERIRSLKGREGRAGYIGLIARPVDAERWARLNGAAAELARRHWPGALTLVLDARAEAPAAARSPDGTIALRCPGNSILRSVVSSLDATALPGGPWHLVLSTSANESGSPPATRLEDAPRGLAHLAVDGGDLSGMPSTLVRVSESGVQVLRAGAVVLEEEGKPRGDDGLDGPRTAP